MEICPLCHHGVLSGRSPMVKNAAILLAGNTRGLWKDLLFLKNKLALDLLLDERKVHANFACTGAYSAQIHEARFDHPGDTLIVCSYFLIDEDAISFCDALLSCWFCPLY